MISLIASVGRNFEIGKAGGLAFESRGELGYFKTTTMGHKILMGRNTFDSLPRRLDGREYYVVSHQRNFPDWVNIVEDVDKFLEDWKNKPEELFVIGGGSIYKTALPYARRLYLTGIAAKCPGADVFFPSFDEEQFTKKQVGEGEFEDGVTFARFVYERK